MLDTPLDRAHSAMEAAPEDDVARLRFYDRLADAELFLMLSREAAGDTLDPETFEIEGGPVVLAFDRADRLAEFAGRTVPFAALSGRRLTALLAGRRTGLGLNVGVAPSSILIPADALDWLAATLGSRPAKATERPISIAPPGDLPETLLTALDAKLAAAEGLARFAYLALVTYAPARPGHLLVFVDAAPGAEQALAAAVGEALTFSGVEAGELDVAFFAAADPMTARIAQYGLRFDLPGRSGRALSAAPAGDPSRPPRLR